MLQASGTGMMIPILMNTVLLITPPEKHGSAMGICGCAMSPCQTSSLNQLPKEAYPHGVAIMNTLQQISAALGSSLFIGIMSAAQLKAINNSATEQIAVATGFQAGASVAVIFVIVGLCLSFTLRLDKKKKCSAPNLKLVND